LLIRCEDRDRVAHVRVHLVARAGELRGRRRAGARTSPAWTRGVAGGRSGGARGVHASDHCLAPRIGPTRDRGQSNDLRIGEREIAGVSEQEVGRCADGTRAAPARAARPEPGARPSRSGLSTE
jgi:hypothetical protein